MSDMHHDADKQNRAGHDPRKPASRPTARIGDGAAQAALRAYESAITEFLDKRGEVRREDRLLAMYAALIAAEAHRVDPS
jgi:hypothetical protein